MNEGPEQGPFFFAASPKVIVGEQEVLKRKELIVMDERVKKTLEYIDGRMKELDALIYGTDDNDEYDGLIKSPCFSYDSDYIEAATEEISLYKIREMLKGS